MNIQPIEFAHVFNGKPYFVPHIDKSGLQLYNRAIVLSGSGKFQNYFVRFSIIDNYRYNLVLITNPITGTFAANLERDSVVFRANDHPKYREHINNLASGELRGKLAESTASLLFINLYGRTEAVKKWVPKMYEQLTEFSRKEKSKRAKVA